MPYKLLKYFLQLHTLHNTAYPLCLSSTNSFINVDSINKHDRIVVNISSECLGLLNYIVNVQGLRQHAISPVDVMLYGDQFVNNLLLSQSSAQAVYITMDIP